MPTIISGMGVYVNTNITEMRVLNKHHAFIVVSAVVAKTSAIREKAERRRRECRASKRFLPDVLFNNLLSFHQKFKKIPLFTKP
ncbi:MAG: hypothetical protein AAF512_09340 [Pseudomonadota bacterium]